MRAEVNDILNRYPESTRHNLLALRQIILWRTENKFIGLCQ